MLKRLVLISLAVLLAAASPVFAAPKFPGRWILTVTIPESPGSNNKLIFTVNVDASPRGASLHGRMTITDFEGRAVGGAWRQVGKKVSVAYELPCADDGPCASLILTGKIKDGGAQIKKGTVIVMWDTPNSNNPSLYDTSNGSFSGTRLE
ncbi:MAG: hypothetical protein WAU45_19395 [Blastocatellia bacterium]